MTPDLAATVKRLTAAASSISPHGAFDSGPMRSLIDASPASFAADIFAVLAELERVTGERDAHEQSLETHTDTLWQMTEDYNALKAKVATLERQLAEAKAEIAHVEEALARMYRWDNKGKLYSSGIVIAHLCDAHLDRSGALLGRVRSRSLELHAQSTEVKEADSV